MTTANGAGSIGGMSHPSYSPKIPGPLDLVVRNLFCIGRNYGEHAKELGNAIPTEPVVFLKPSSSVIFSGGEIVIPKVSERVDHEVELVIAIGKVGRRVPEDRANEYIAGVGVGVDVTARDLQDQAKKKALPWAVAKGFDTFAVLGEFQSWSGGNDFSGLDLELSVNGERRQYGHVKDMLFSVPKLISWLSGVYTLAPGDLIYTGTPSGVAPIVAGDRLEASLKQGGRVISSLKVGVEAGE